MHKNIIVNLILIFIVSVHHYGLLCTCIFYGVVYVFFFVLMSTLIVNDLLRFIYDIFNVGLLVNLSRSTFVAVSRAASLHFIIMRHRLRLQT